MEISKKRKIIIGILTFFTFLTSIICGVFIGFSFAFSSNFELTEELDMNLSAQPTEIFDINKNLITEFFSDEKRHLVSFHEIPEHLIMAILTREDKDFYEHKGFSLKGIMRAAFAILQGKFAGGASSLTQQVAGNKYTDRKDISMKRKLVELWWAFQLERRYTKNEILEFYLNEMPFGHGTNGVEAASQYYFKHSVRDITLAESVLLVNTLASHTKYSPIQNPQTAKTRQREILDQMVAEQKVSAEKADLSFDDYWDNYDWTRSSETGAYYAREDKAPWFSWYINEQLQELFLGSDDIFRGGLKVHTTLNLEYQKIADEVMKKGINTVDKVYQQNSSVRIQFADDQFMPIIDLLSLSFNVRDVRTAGSKQKANAVKYYHDDLNQIINLMGLGFNNKDLKRCAHESYKKKEAEIRKTKVEGGLLCLDSRTGYIMAMVGGNQFSSRTNMFNRAVYGSVQPGSSYKPLYYSAAIDSKQFSPATRIVDQPVIFTNDDGTPYTPLNYKGQWSPNGSVLLRTALAKSLNVPSLKILNALGIDKAIDHTSKLLGIYDPAAIEATFPRKLPLGLGIIRVAPIQMARAYSSFPNGGREVIPISIRYIEDRKNRKIIDLETELWEKQKAKGDDIQLLSPQGAFMMVDIMQGATRAGGTLHYALNTVGGMDQPIAGKTGTTQNWSDAWAIGYTPYMTTAVWFGFDTPGNSLGLNQSGAVAAGPVWAEFMKRAHESLPIKDFEKPNTGLIEIEICNVSGKRPHPEKVCEGHTYKQWFIRGTEPTTSCDIHVKYDERKDDILDKLRDRYLGGEANIDLSYFDDLSKELGIDMGESDPFAEPGFDSTSPLLDDGNLLLSDTSGENPLLEGDDESVPTPEASSSGEPGDIFSDDSFNPLMD